MRPVRLGHGSKKSSAYFLMTFSPAEAGLLVLRPPHFGAHFGGLIVFREFRHESVQDRIMIYGPKSKATQPNLS